MSETETYNCRIKENSQKYILQNIAKGKLLMMREITENIMENIKLHKHVRVCLPRACVACHSKQTETNTALPRREITQGQL